MSDTIQAETPGEGWTLHGVAYCQVALVRDDITEICSLIHQANRDGAIALISASIRQLEAARRHLS